MTQQERLVAEARSWIGTPYHLGGRVKGAGVDCATFLAEVLIACGLSEREDLGVYSHDWFHHSESERYMLRLLRHAAKSLETVAYRSIDAKPGDLVLIRAVQSRLYNHGGIVTAWPRVLHAIHPAVEEIDAAIHPLWAHRQIAVFRPHFSQDQ